MMEVVGELTKADLAECFIIGEGEVLRGVAEQVGVDLTNIHVIDTTDEEANEAFAVRCEEDPEFPFKAKGIRRRAKKPMDRCLMMQRIDDVDITFGGTAAPPATSSSAARPSSVLLTASRPSPAWASSTSPAGRAARAI